MNPDPQAHSNQDVVDLLRRVLDLLGGPQKNGAALARVEEAHSFTASGIGCEAWDETAASGPSWARSARFSIAPVSWTDIAAERDASAAMRNEVRFDEAFRYLLGAAIMEAPQTVNGVNNRGWDSVKSLLELAILLAENNATVMPGLFLPVGRTMSPDLKKRLEQVIHARQATNLQVPS